MGNGIDVQEIAAAVGKSRRQVRRLAAAEGWRFEAVLMEGGGHRRLYEVSALPVDVQRALAAQMASVPAPVPALCPCVLATLIMISIASLVVICTGIQPLRVSNHTPCATAALLYCVDHS